MKITASIGEKNAIKIKYQDRKTPAPVTYQITAADYWEILDEKTSTWRPANLAKIPAMVFVEAELFLNE